MERRNSRGADLAAVQRAVQAATAASGVRQLSARPKDEVIEIFGIAENAAARYHAFRVIVDTLGERTPVVNHIQIAGTNPK